MGRYTRQLKRMSFFKKEGIKKVISFLKALNNDPRIPRRDKVILTGILTSLLTPFDLIPDFIPVVGHLDDLFMIALILDYIFNTLDQEIILDHFLWKKESYQKIRRRAKVVSYIIPNFIRKKLWHKVEVSV